MNPMEDCEQVRSAGRADADTRTGAWITRTRAAVMTTESQHRSSWRTAAESIGARRPRVVHSVPRSSEPA